MGIEPLGSVMTYQAQNTSVVKTEAVQNQAESMDAIAQDNGALVDQTTAAVAQTAETSADGSGADGQAAYYQDTNVLAKEEQAQAATKEQIKKAVEQFNKNANTEAVFGIHEGTNRVTIKIVDKDNKKVIKELPPEKTLDMIAKVWEMAGILVDEKR